MNKYIDNSTLISDSTPKPWERHPVSGPTPSPGTVGYPDNNPKTAMGATKVPMDLVPPALAKGAAEAFANGAAKYGPYNWREKKISSSVYYAATLRHLQDWWDRVDEDDRAPDSHVHHIKHAAACLGLILDTLNTALLNDNRPPRLERNGKDTGSESQGHGENPAQDAPSVLAHAGAERDGTTGIGLPCMPADINHAGYGGYEGGTVRGDRNESTGQEFYPEAGADCAGYPRRGR